MGGTAHLLNLQHIQGEERVFGGAAGPSEAARAASRVNAGTEKSGTVHAGGGLPIIRRGDIGQEFDVRPENGVESIVCDLQQETVSPVGDVRRWQLLLLIVWSTSALVVVIQTLDYRPQGPRVLLA